MGMGYFKLGWNVALKIIVFGPLISLFAFLMLEVLTAHFFVNFIINNLEDRVTLSLIILVLLAISFITSIAAGLLITKEDLKKIVVIKASTMAYFVSLACIIVISYAYMLTFHTSFFAELNWIDFFLQFPVVIVFFGIYAFNSIISLYLFTGICYFIFFIIFLEKYHEYKGFEKFNYNRDNEDEAYDGGW